MAHRSRNGCCGSVRTPAPLAIADRLNDLADEVWEMAWQTANERLQREYTTLQQAKRANSPLWQG